MTTKRLTDERWLNLFEREHTNKNGVVQKWGFASRMKEPVESIAHKKPDAVIIAAVVNNPDQPLRHVCTVEYRIPIGGLEFGFPAGLVDKGETAAQAAKRELYEETGLIFKAHKTSPLHLVSSAGMSDESVQIVFGTARGTVTKENQAGDEDIQTHLLTQSQIATLVGQENPLGAVGWSCKAWPILVAFAQGGLFDFYGIKKS